MRIYEAKIKYDLIRSGEAKSLSDPESVVAYMQGAFEGNPLTGVVLGNRSGSKEQ
jgi:hypothetical protein